MPGAVLKYKKKLSGPLLDRIDLHIDVAPVDQEKLTSIQQEESSEIIRARVLTARTQQLKRFTQTRIKMNGEMNPKDIKKLCKLSEDAVNLLKTAITRLSLSARSYFKIIKVAQTIADLETKDRIELSHVSEALQYRIKEEM